MPETKKAATMKKEWWDSKALWIGVGIVTAITMDKIGVQPDTATFVKGLIVAKVGIQGGLEALGRVQK